MENAVGYITKEEKALSLNEMKMHLNNRLEHMSHIDNVNGERATYINCLAQNTYDDFERIRKYFHRDNGVIAHHYYQSFQKDDNITPEQAHKIGTQLAERMFNNYQVVVATHIDRDHIHNHIIVNSCNIITGQKWNSNKRSLNEIRKESDKLCLQNGLGIIEKQSKYRGIDRTTYQLGIKGESWKIHLVRDLEQAISVCKSKNEFITFMTAKDYTVKYMNRHITITKNGEKKGIRVDTLAKQFGMKYTKDNLEKNMGYYVKPSETEIVQKKTNKTNTTKSNWEFYEQWLFNKNKYCKSDKNNIVRDKMTVKLISAAEKSHKPNLFEFVVRAFLLLLGIKYRRKKYFRYRVAAKRHVKRDAITFGNIEYKELIKTAGNNYTIRVTTDKLLRLSNQPIIYSALVNKQDSTLTITVKEKDKEFLLKLIGFELQQKELDAQNEILSNQRVYHKLKEKAKLIDCKLQYLIVTEEQKKILNDNYIEFAHYHKDDKINIVYLPEQEELIKRLIYSKSEDKKKETPQQRNNRIYAQLKKNAERTGRSVGFRTKLTKTQLDELSKTNLQFAYFENSDNSTLYNIAYDRKDEEAVSKIINAYKLNTRNRAPRL